MSARLQQTILIADDEPANVRILAEVLKAEYRLVVATNGSQALDRARATPRPDLILLDVQMPGMSGHEVCKALKIEETLRDIPVIFITAMSAEEDEAFGLALGAVDYITKPFNTTIVKARVHAHMELAMHRARLQELVRLRTSELQNTQTEVVKRLALAAEYKDHDTGAHINRMANSSAILGQAAGLSIEKCHVLWQASVMHDVGKIGIPDEILNKPAKLTPEEIAVIETHTTIGGDILSGFKCELLCLAQNIALSHHEKWNGSGYPAGLFEDSIPLEGRIVAVCDVFDALTSERPYKCAWPVADAVEELKMMRETAFDPHLVDLFLENLPLVLAARNKTEPIL